MLDGKGFEIIGELYDAALQPRGWSRALASLRHILESDAGGIVMQSRTTGTARMRRFQGPDQTILEAYENYYGPISPTFRDSVARPEGCLYTDDMYPDYVEYLGSEVYNDLFKPNSLAHMIQTQRLAGQDSVLTVVFRRGTGQSFYRDKEKHRFSVLEPHIRRAWALTERLAAMEANSHAALDAVEDGVVLVDDAGRLCFANAGAERMLARRDGLSVREGRLVADRGEEAQRLRCLVAGAAGFGRGADLPPGGDMAVTRPSGRRPLLLSVTPVGPGGLPGSPGRAAVTVTITDPDDRPAPPEERLAALFGLTPAEARLAAEMATGDSLEDIAGRLGVTRETARTTLKRLYAKTDTHRQAELVRLLLSVPPRSHIPE